VSFAREGGTGTPVPDLSIEVDDLDEALHRVRRAHITLEYGPTDEPWGVRRFYVRDPPGKLVNILQHPWPLPVTRDAGSCPGAPAPAPSIALQRNASMRPSSLYSLTLRSAMVPREPTIISVIQSTSTSV